MDIDDNKTTTTLLSLARDLLNARQNKRARLFAETVMPAFSSMESSHQSFIVVFGKIRRICLELATYQKARPNDWCDKAKVALEELQQIFSDVDQGRAKRRSLFEEARVRVETQIKKSEQLALSDEEQALTQGLFNQIREYFWTEENRYGHSVRLWLDVLATDIRAASSSTDGDQFAAQMLERWNAIGQAEEHIEEKWAEICRTFFTLKNCLQE